MPDKKNWIFIAWAQYGRRSESLAMELGARLYFIHYLKFKNPFYAPVKYILQSFRTIYVLFKERPDVVFVQSPPFVCGLTVYSYCLIKGARFVLDHHSASFGSIWDWTLPVQKFLARRAITNVIANQHWADTINSWSANSFILIDSLPELPESRDFVVTPGFNIVFINTFADDEPIEAVLSAAALLQDIHFYITGNTECKPASFFEDIPKNVTFTGFIPDTKYSGLLREAQAVMTLTTRDHTLQGGGFEAISLGKPLIVSDWVYLQTLFPRGAVYVKNSAEGIRDGALIMREKYDNLHTEMMAFRNDCRQEWNKDFTKLKRLIIDTQG